MYQIHIPYPNPRQVGVLNININIPLHEMLTDSAECLFDIISSSLEAGLNDKDEM